MGKNKGNTAEVFPHGEGKVCKLFYAGTPRIYVELEYENTKTLYDMGIRVPKAFEIVTIEDRYGIIYEEIKGIPMRKCTDNERMFELFVAEHKKMLNMWTSALLSYKEFLIEMIKGKNAGAISADLKAEINALPDGNHILHGDYHSGNIMITDEGEPVIIDLISACRGPKEYDIARTFFLLENDVWQEDRYLNKMGYHKEDITIYLEIVRKTRKFE